MAQIFPDASALRLFAVFFMGGLIYLAPTLLAWNRSHHNQFAIFLLNLLLGWTVLGWIAALVWAATSPPPKS